MKRRITARVVRELRAVPKHVLTGDNMKEAYDARKERRKRASFESLVRLCTKIAMPGIGAPRFPSLRSSPMKSIPGTSASHHVGKGLDHGIGRPPRQPGVKPVTTTPQAAAINPHRTMVQASAAFTAKPAKVGL